MSITIKSNSGNGNIVDGSLISFSYSEEVSSLDPSKLTGGTGDVSFSAISIDKKVSEGAKDNSLLLINNDIVMSVNNSGDIAFSVKNASTTNGVVSASGPTTQSKMNVIKKADPFTGTLKAAIDYYCGLVGITPTYEGSLATHLAAVTVAFLGWEDSVWNKLKELISVQRAYDSSRVVTSGSVRDNGYYAFEMYVVSSTNTIRFREVALNKISLDEVQMDKTYSVSSIDASKSVDVYSYNTVKKAEPVYTPIYDIKNYASDLAESEAFRSSVDMSGVTLNANETAEKLFSMDTHIDYVLQPKCVSTISRIPYRRAAGNSVSAIAYASGSRTKITVQNVGYQNLPITGDTVLHAGFTSPFSYLNGYHAVVNYNLDELWYEVESVNGSTTISGATTGTYDTPYSFGEYVIVGDGDIPVQPEQWIAQGGSLTIAKTDNFGELKVTVVAPKTDQLPSANDPNTYVSGPFQVGVEVADSQDYPACWFMATGVSFNKKPVSFYTGGDPLLTSKDSAYSVDNIFINNSMTQATAGLAASQTACGPAYSVSATSSEPLSFGTMIGMISSEDMNNYRIQSVSHDGFGANMTASPYLTIKDFNTMMAGKTFSNFDTSTTGMKFNEFSVIPKIGA